MNFNQLSQPGGAGKAHTEESCVWRAKTWLLCAATVQRPIITKCINLYLQRGKICLRNRALWRSWAPVCTHRLGIYQLTARHMRVWELHFKICWQVRGLHISKRRCIKAFAAPEGAEPSLIKRWLRLMTASLKTIWRSDVRKKWAYQTSVARDPRGYTIHMQHGMCQMKI